MADLQALRQQNVDVVVTLLEEHERAAMGVTYLDGRIMSLGFTHYAFPIPDAGVPEDPRAFRFLVKIVASLLGAGDKVVVHCAAGKGRSGLFAGCVMRTLGASADEALADLAAARGPDTPETPEQVAFIRNWE